MEFTSARRRQTGHGTLGIALAVVALAIPLSASAAGAAQRAPHVAWGIQHVPSPAGGAASFLSGVSCTSSTKCTAVGAATKSGHLVTLAERWQNQAWTPEAAVEPAHSASSTLYAVACVGTKLCQAVGYASPGTNSTNALAELWNGTHWAIEKTLNPSGAARSYLEGVACPTVTDCVAVGYAATSSGHIFAFAEHWTGKGWFLTSVPAPAGNAGSSLTSTACTSSSSCTAVGHFYSASGTTGVLAERWNGSKWARVPAPGLAGARSSVLSAVACATTSSCVAVGSATRPGSTSIAFAERWNGSQWSVLSTPDPAGSHDNALNAVWCASASTCVAVGGQTSGAIGTSLIEEMTGGTWHLGSAPSVTGASTSALRAVTCASQCEAVGNQTNHETVSSPLAERGAV